MGKTKSTDKKGNAQGQGEQQFCKERSWVDQDCEGRRIKYFSSLQEKSGPQPPVMHGSSISPFVWGDFPDKFCPRMVGIKCTFSFFLSGNSRDMSVWEGALRGA